METPRSLTSEQMQCAKDLIECSHEFSSVLQGMKEKAQMLPTFNSVEPAAVPKAFIAPQVDKMEQLLRENAKVNDLRHSRKDRIRKEYQERYLGFVPLSKTPSPPGGLSASSPAFSTAKTPEPIPAPLMFASNTNPQLRQEAKEN